MTDIAIGSNADLGRARTPIDYRSRPDAVRAQFCERDVDALIVSDPTNLRWVCGFGGSFGRLVVGTEGASLIVDLRYAERAAAEIETAGVDVEVVAAATAADIDAAVIAACADSDRVGVESDRMSYDAVIKTQALIEVRPMSGVIDELRRTKQPAEVERIALAASIADRALAHVGTDIGGATEREVQTELEYAMARLGSEAVSFATIVASGPDNAARPHHATGNRMIGSGDTVIIDFGATVDGYHSDMTRSFVIGEPSDVQRRRFDALAEAQRIAVGEVAAGVAAASVDAAAREVLATHGLDELFIHGIGHGVGLEIHETPFIGATSTATLQIGDVVTVEPGIYESGFGGFRIEDLVEVTADGARPLSAAPISIGT